MNDHAHFPPTPWTKLREAVGSQDGADRPAAISYLCTHYWYPLYVFARLKGFKHEDAQDQTQMFLSRLIQRNSLERVDAEKGRLRAYLLTAFQNQWINQWQHDCAARRGGGMAMVPLDMIGADERFASEAYHEAVQPEAEYDRAWALALINACIDIMAAEHQHNGDAERFAVLRPFLSPSSVANASLAEAASRLGMSDMAVRQRVFRLRARFAKLLREHVAGSLADPTPEAIDEEMRSLRHALEQF
jgi:RNA polymerase sigma-70 factor (ECF subfamily)